jgi:cytoskeletal protein CcmA (bactofilin family)
MIDIRSNMKRTLLTLGMIIGLGLLSSLAWVGITHAANVRSGDTPSVTKGETIDGSVYIAGRSITIDGTVKGDLFCAGQDVFVTGTVEGDVICAGQFVRITGTVLGDVRAAGQQLDVSATIDGSATLAAQSLVIKPETKIGRDLTVGGESLRVGGQVARDLLGVGQDVIIDSKIGRDAHLEFQNIALENNADIGGNLAYRSPEKAQVADGAKVAGETTYQTAPKDQQYNKGTLQLWSTFYGFCSMLLIGLAAIAIAPRWFDGVGAAIRTRPVGSFAYGAAALLGVPIVAALLMATFIGLPLGIIMLLVWIAAMIGAMVITAYAVGWMIIEKLAWPSRGQRIASLIVGLLVLAVLGLIPVVGGITIFVSLIFGLGALLVILINRLRPQQKTASKHAKA